MLLITFFTFGPHVPIIAIIVQTLDQTTVKKQCILMFSTPTQVLTGSLQKIEMVWNIKLQAKAIKICSLEFREGHPSPPPCKEGNQVKWTVGWFRSQKAKAACRALCGIIVKHFLFLEPLRTGVRLMVSYMISLLVYD